MRSASSRITAFVVAVVGLACYGMQNSWAQDHLELPSHERPASSYASREIHGSKATRYLTPNLVATPPPLRGDALRQAKFQDADFRPWRVLDKSTAARRSRPTAVAVPPPPITLLKGIMLLPGIPKTAGNPTEGMEAYAATVPIPPNLKGVRDYGAQIPKETILALSKLIGSELDDDLVPQIREAVILGFAGHERKLDSILVPEMSSAEGILKVVVIEAIAIEPEANLVAKPSPKR